MDYTPNFRKLIFQQLAAYYNHEPDESIQHIPTLFH
jgi:hypothetical protein